MLQEKDKKQQDPKCIALILIYNKFSPNLTAIVSKTLNVLHTNKIYMNYPKNTQSHPLNETKI